MAAWWGCLCGCRSVLPTAIGEISLSGPGAIDRRLGEIGEISLSGLRSCRFLTSKVDHAAMEPCSFRYTVAIKETVGGVGDR